MGKIKTAALLLEHSRTQPIERFCLFDAVVARNFAAIHHNLQPARLTESDDDDYRKALAHAVEQDDAEIIKLLLSVETVFAFRAPSTPGTLPPSARRFNVRRSRTAMRMSITGASSMRSGKTITKSWSCCSPRE